MIITAMEPERSADWFDFFDHRAFADHGEWRDCYCAFYFQPPPPEYAGGKAGNREYARWLIDRKLMRGYLAYEDGKVIAWCNANRKSAFGRLADTSAEAEKTLAIVCFIVQKEFRGMGIARRLLDTVVADALNAGMAVIEAYPKRRTKNAYGNYHGPYALYEKGGFVPEKVGAVTIMRRYLQG